MTRYALIRRLPAAASLVAHLLLLAGLSWHPRVQVAPVRLPGTAAGTRLTLTYSPRASAFAAATARARPAPPSRRPAPSTARLTAPVLAQAPAAPGSGSSTGSDSLGQGDISIALMQFFPDPRPDLSQLPHGIRGDVVLEAVIDATGRISQLTVKQSLGYGVDQSVLATVQQWTFHPAMRDGKPVASQQEFHFHYERG
ncbi:MAG TPA: energy transducer TonB [Acidobacteriaceae bacterium]